MCVCSLRYLTCKAHAPCGYVLPVWLYNIFLRYLIKARSYKEITQHKMCVLIFCTILSEIFFILRGTERDNIIYVYRSSCIYYCQILMKLEFSRQFFEKHPNINFHENTSSGSRVGFRNFVNASKNVSVKFQVRNDRTVSV